MRRWRLNSGYNGTTDQRRTKAGTISAPKHYIERNLGSFISGFDVLGLAPRHWHRIATIEESTGNPVSTWTDSSGNNFSATEATNRPTVAVQNGIRCLAFNGTQRLGLGNVMSTATAGFYIGLVRWSADPTAGTSTTSGMPYTSQTSGNPVFWSDGNIYEQWGASSRPSFGNPTPNLTNWTIYQVENNGSANGWVVRINGTVLSTQTASVSFSTSHEFGGMSGWRFNGNIAEIITFNRSVTQTERESLEGYLAWQYGVTSVLATNHPYKNSGP